MNFAALAGRAEELIRQNGQEMTLVCVAPAESAESEETEETAEATEPGESTGTGAEAETGLPAGCPSPETGLPETTESETAFFGVWDSLGKNAEPGIAESADAVVWAAGLAIPDPSIVDRVECGGEAFRVLKLETIRGGSVRMLHRFVLQRM